MKLMGTDVGYWSISVWRGSIGLLGCLLSYHEGGTGARSKLLGKRRSEGQSEGRNGKATG